MTEDDRAVRMPPKSQRRVSMADPTYLHLLEAEHQAAVALFEAWNQGESFAGLTPYLLDVEAAVKAVEEARR